MTVVSITEVGLRDGLQAESAPFSTEQKVELANKLLAAGVRRLEAASFVSPKAVPRMADAEAVVKGIDRPDGLTLEALVPNVRGGERAAAVNLDVWVPFISASETHSLANANSGVEEAFARIRPLPEMAAQAGATTSAVIVTAFDCPFEGQTSVEQVIRIAKWFEGIGVTTLKLGDTIGTASPTRVKKLVSELQRQVPSMELVLHFHNTRGLGLVNVLAGIESGVTRFEASIGGIGGCPFAPGATGNVSTEDVVHMLHLENMETGIDLNKLIEAGRYVADVFDRPLPSHVLNAGPVGTLHHFDKGQRAIG